MQNPSVDVSLESYVKHGLKNELDFVQYCDSGTHGILFLNCCMSASCFDCFISHKAGFLATQQSPCAELKLVEANIAHVSICLAETFPASRSTLLLITSSSSSSSSYNFVFLLFFFLQLRLPPLLLLITSSSSSSSSYNFVFLLLFFLQLRLPPLLLLITSSSSSSSSYNFVFLLFFFL
ncbi:hypothetical protein BaRGS_00015912 [Batillaria attramentaria]|uniref:Uncharacterized protein n=1 Tax=Batillaria attramentaria TaxID=370345 RepID=A0ABD0L119_9CAEN